MVLSSHAQIVDDDMMMMTMNCFVVWLTGEKRLALFPAGTIVRDPHHSELLTRCDQDFNLRRI